MATFKITAYINADEDEVDAEDVFSYVEDAIQHWGGQYCPEHPLFSTNKETTVREVRQLKRELELSDEG